jgi:hypothetical protein
LHDSLQVGCEPPEHIELRVLILEQEVIPARLVRLPPFTSGIQTPDVDTCVRSTWVSEERKLRRIRIIDCLDGYDLKWQRRNFQVIVGAGPPRPPKVIPSEGELLRARLIDEENTKMAPFGPPE